MAYFPVPDDAFKDALPKSVGDYLVIILNWLWNAVAKVTTHDTHVYANGTSGDDANDGLSAGTPKKTLQMAVDLFPSVIDHWAVVHMDGVFAEQGNVAINRIGKGQILLDGGDSVDVVWGPETADISGVSSIGFAAAGWVADEHAGYWVEILSGAAAGQTRLIHSHDGTTITPAKDFTVDPGAVQFRIVRPATTWDASSVYSSIQQQIGCIPVTLQRLWFTGNKSRIDSRAGNDGSLALRGVICDNSYFGAPVYTQTVGVYGAPKDPYTFASMSAVFLPLAIRTVGEALSIERAVSYIFGGYYRKIEILDSFLASLITSGCRVRDGVSLKGCSISRSNAIRQYTGYAPSLIENAAGIGLEVVDSNLEIRGVTIQNCGSHAIESNHSKIAHNGSDPLDGTGNAGAGVHAHSGSVVLIKDGSPPTLTGTVGDISTDGTTEATTFAAVDSGEAYSDDLENTMIKEVP